jgi:hypothetical protein
MKFKLLSPARGRGWVRGLRTAYQSRDLFYCP